MKIVDLNVLLYAVNSESMNHARALDWWESALADVEESVGLPWIVLLGFLRVATNPRAFPVPLSAEVATQVIDGWLSEQNVRVVRERDDHWERLRGLVRDAGVAGNLTTDLHLAALALAHDAVLVSFDNDFARFGGLRWENPARSVKPN